VRSVFLVSLPLVVACQLVYKLTSNQRVRQYEARSVAEIQVLGLGSQLIENVATT
jgi:hypothetical protein